MLTIGIWPGENLSENTVNTSFTVKVLTSSVMSTACGLTDFLNSLCSLRMWPLSAFVMTPVQVQITQHNNVQVIMTWLGWYR